MVDIGLHYLICYSFIKLTGLLQTQQPLVMILKFHLEIYTYFVQSKLFCSYIFKRNVMIVSKYDRQVNLLLVFYNPFPMINGTNPTHLKSLIPSKNSTNGTIRIHVSINIEDIKLLTFAEIKNIRSIEAIKPKYLKTDIKMR